MKTEIDMQALLDEAFETRPTRRCLYTKLSKEGREFLDGVMSRFEETGHKPRVIVVVKVLKDTFRFQVSSFSVSRHTQLKCPYCTLRRAGEKL